MIFRYFPFLGFKALDEDDVEAYELDPLPVDREYYGLVFEWAILGFIFLVKERRKR